MNEEKRRPVEMGRGDQSRTKVVRGDGPAVSEGFGDGVDDDGELFRVHGGLPGGRSGWGALVRPAAGRPFAAGLAIVAVVLWVIAPFADRQAGRD